jgi:transposase
MSGMHTTGMSFKAIGRQMGYHYTVVSRLVRKHTRTNNVKDLPRSGRPRVTSDHDDMALQRLVSKTPDLNTQIRSVKGMVYVHD